MHSSNDHAVKVLNSLIETTLDSAHGYKEAAENVESSEYRSMFSERSTRRLELSRRLQETLKKLIRRSLAGIKICLYSAVTSQRLLQRTSHLRKRTVALSHPLGAFRRKTNQVVGLLSRHRPSPAQPRIVQDR
jgi:hypothetical protein